MFSRRIDTVIVGGGQSGLALSYYLSREGREHGVLEREPAVANAWRKQRWDSFTLVTPNFQVRMPGAEYDGNEPYGFMLLSEIVRYSRDRCPCPESVGAHARHCRSMFAKESSFSRPICTDEGRSV